MVSLVDPFHDELQELKKNYELLRLQLTKVEALLMQKSNDTDIIRTD